MNREPFADGEWYHCFTRGIDKRKVFTNQSDYFRFLQLLHVVNSEVAVHRSDLKIQHKEIFGLQHSKPLVSIASYCLMPNHFHIVMRQENEWGISRFMRKLGTAYVMYFNIRYKRIGNLFVKPFRSKHISNDEYLNHVVQYVHLNPLELFVPNWKRGEIAITPSIEAKLSKYPYSSLSSYLGEEKAERAILSESGMALVGKDVPFTRIIKDAREYYAELYAYAHPH